MAPLLERPCHQRGYCHFTCWNRRPISRYFHQAPWREAIPWTLKLTKHHWFSECGLVYRTSDLKLAMLEKYTFMSKILFTQNFIRSLWFKWFQDIYIYVCVCVCFSKLVHVPHIYIFYWPYAKIRWISIFRAVFKVSGIAEAVLTAHVQPMAPTYLAPGPDMSGSLVSSLYKGGERTPLEP
jgi:hypothetical protein